MCKRMPRQLQFGGEAEHNALGGAITVAVVRLLLIFCGKPPPGPNETGQRKFLRVAPATATL